MPLRVMVSTGLTASVPRRFAVEGADSVCLLPDGCVGPEVISPLAALLWTGLLALVVLAAVAHVRNAQSVLEEERARTDAEHEAFEAFIRGLNTLEASPMEAAAPVQSPGTTVSRPPPDDGLRRVREVYRETVMAVPHYDEEYDEPLEVNMAAELSEEVATAVAQGQTLSPQLRGALLQQAERARDRRENFLRQVDREVAAIEEHRSGLEAIAASLAAMNERPLSERSFDDLRATWDRLGVLEERCESLLAARQDEVHDVDEIGLRTTAPLLQAYLYTPLEVSFPVLSDGTDLAAKLRTARSRVTAAISRRG